MVQRNEVRWLKQRADSRGPEMLGDRPWIIRSDVELHRFDLMLCFPATGGGRHHPKVFTNPPLPPQSNPEKDSHADVKQLWTVLLRRAHTIDEGPNAPKVPRLEVGSEKDIADAIRVRLTPGAVHVDPASIATIGRIVFAELRGPSDDPETDLAALRTLLWEKSRVQWPGEPDRLPCMVVANYLARQREGGSPLRLVTVVPLVHAPDYLKKHGGPSVCVPGVSIEPLKLAALTELLMTLGTDKQDHRIHLQSGGLTSWIVPYRELVAVVEEVGSFLGVKIACPRNLKLE